METLNRIDPAYKMKMTTFLPVAGLLIYIASTWDALSMAQSQGGSSIAMPLIIALLCSGAALFMAFTHEEEQIEEVEEDTHHDETQERLMRALELCQANVMIADNDLNICYTNESVIGMLSARETKLKELLPQFSSQSLIGTNVDVFHKNPAHQRSMISQLTSVYKTDLKLGEMTFRLIATPINSDTGERLGTVVEWEDKTEALAAQDKLDLVANENTRVKQALDNVTTNAMIADVDGDIVYSNQSVLNMLSAAESDIKKDLPNFNSDKVLGANFDIFHKNPAHQRGMLSSLTSTYSTEIIVGGRTFSLVATPIRNEKDVRIGTVVEWGDRTEEVAIEKEIDNLVSLAKVGDLSVRLNKEGKSGFFLNLSAGLNELVGVADDVINNTARVLDALAHGNLNEKIEKDYQGSYEKLKNDANATVDKFTDIIGRIIESANSVSSGADELAQGNADLSQRTEQQAASLEETASSMEEMTSAVKQSSENSQQANNLATEARDKAVLGGDVVSKAVVAMEEINTSSKKISDIIGVIDEIAFQTNLLALNAAVEAARAGEQGRGFAVVAGEVRNLAQRSAGAAKEIKDLIRDSVTKVSDGTNLVNQSGETLKDIVDSVQRVSMMVGDISSASQEQTSGIEQVNTAIAQMDDMTQQNAALVEEATAAGQAMSDQARQLMQMMSFFSVSGSDVSAQSNVHALQAPPAAPRAPAISASSSGGMPSHPGGDEWEEF